MTDLGERIARVLEEADRKGYGTRPYQELAEAVLADLKLHKQRGTLRVVRYVSNWEVDE